MALPYATENQLKLLEQKTKSELDKKTENINLTANTLEDMNALVTKGRVTDGQLCYCKEDKKLYVLKDNTWSEVGGGGGSGGDFEIVTLSDDMSTYTGTITGTKAVLIKFGPHEFIPTNISEENGIVNCSLTQEDMIINFEFNNGNFSITTDVISESLWNHFITITSEKDGSIDGYAYFNFYDTNEQEIDSISSLFTRIQDKFVMGSGYLHGKYIVYMSTVDSNVVVFYLESGATQSNIIIDSTFGIFDRVSRVN